MKQLYSLLATALLAGTIQVMAQSPFPSIDTSFVGNTVVLPQSPFKYKVVFRQGESMVVNKDGQSALARGNHDFTGYVPINNSAEHGYLIVNHELTDSSTVFGDGGGMTVFEVQRQNNEWAAVGTYRNVDFSTVGGTYNNCGGAQTPYGNVLTAEEFSPNTNTDLHGAGRRVRDTSDVQIMFNGQSRTLKRWQNMGWMVEVDPTNARAVRKLYKMGRYSHEGAWCMSDGKTVYLTDDTENGVFFKFIATTANDYSDGQLYAYKQSADGESGDWLTLPMELDSLLDIRTVAIRRGATLFIRLEWPIEVNGKIYITETGRDDVNWAAMKRLGGVPAHHLQADFATSDSTFVDFYGRILEFDPATNNMRAYLNGGMGGRHRGLNLASPDGLESVTLKGKTYIVMNEDIIGRTMGRVGLDAQKARRDINEIYWVDASIENPSTDDLMRFLVGPAGSETTGGRFTPDGKTYFVNIQHPSSSNAPPFDKSATIAITGFENFASYKDPDFDPTTSTFQIHPNPASRVIIFNKTTDVAIYNVAGVRVLVERNADRIDVSTLTSGTYFVQTIDNEVQKLIVQ